MSRKNSSSKKEKNTVCKLCLNEKELLRKSHIIPDFIYRESEMYDSNHRVRTFTKEDLLTGNKIKLEQSGIYVGDILCHNCDNKIISGYERYSAMAIYGKAIPVDKAPDCQDYMLGSNVLTICQHVDYTNYKLFLLSILWRASISNHQFFDQVKLSNQQQESLRIMILNGDAGKENDFPFLVSSFKSTNAILSTDLIVSPIKVINPETRIESVKFIFAGMCYIFLLGTNLNISGLEKMIFRPSNELTIYHFDVIGATKFRDEYFGINQ